MLIIIEGGDGTGKSTLAHRIIELTGGEYIHASAPKRHPLIEYTEPLASYKRGSGQTIVCDRWHVGELVYGPRYRGKSGLNKVQFRAVDSFLDELGAVLVWVTHDVNTQVSRLLERGENPIMAQLADEADAFRYAVERSCIPVINNHAHWISPQFIINQAEKRDLQ